jgi:hypothetical protein
MKKIFVLATIGIAAGIGGMPLQQERPALAAAINAGQAVATELNVSHLAIDVPELPHLANSGVTSVVAGKSYAGTMTANYYDANGALPLTAMVLTSNNPRVTITTGTVSTSTPGQGSGSFKLPFTMQVQGNPGDTVVVNVSIERTDGGRISVASQTLTFIIAEAMTDPDPSEPTDPTEPADPDRPTDPDEPTNPTDPSEPVEPELPDDSEMPDEPGTGETGGQTPDVTGKPDQSDEVDKPNAAINAPAQTQQSVRVPSKEQGAKHNVHSRPRSKQHGGELPQLGNGLSLTTTGMGVFGFLLSIGLAFWRRRL